MRQGSEHRPMKSVIAAIFLLFLWGSASAGDERSPHRSAAHRQFQKELRLQLRIVESKRNRESLRYYKSVARQLKTGKFKRPSSAFGGTDDSVRRSSH